MREATVIELVQFALHPAGFTAGAVVEMFGPEDASANLTRGFRILPREPLYASVDVELASFGRTEPEPVGITVRFVELVAMRFAPLVARFGEPVQWPRPKPESAIPWRFTCDGGWLRIETAEDDSRELYSAASVAVRRAMR